MKVLVVNCSPVKTGATAEIIKYVTTYLEGDFDVKSICIDDYEIQFCKRVMKIKPSIYGQKMFWGICQQAKLQQ